MSDEGPPTWRPEDVDPGTTDLLLDVCLPGVDQQGPWLDALDGKLWAVVTAASVVLGAVGFADLKDTTVFQHWVLGGLVAGWAFAVIYAAWGLWTREITVGRDADDLWRRCWSLPRDQTQALIMDDVAKAWTRNTAVIDEKAWFFRRSFSGFLIEVALTATLLITLAVSG